MKKELAYPSLTFDGIPLLEEEFDLGLEEIDTFTVPMQNEVLDMVLLYLRDMTNENRELLRDTILSARATAGMDMDGVGNEEEEAIF
jgi:hypothetical protein